MSDEKTLGEYAMFSYVVKLTVRKEQIERNVIR